MTKERKLKKRIKELERTVAQQYAALKDVTAKLEEANRDYSRLLNAIAYFSRIDTYRMTCDRDRTT